MILYPWDLAQWTGWTYDNDGDLDIFTCGWNGTSSFAIIYRNDALTFTDINADLQGVRSGVSPWGDYDNDGDLDLLLTGWDGANSHSLIYQNNEGIFTDIEAGLSNINGAAALGDYDNDGTLISSNLAMERFCRITPSSIEIAGEAFLKLFQVSLQ